VCECKVGHTFEICDICNNKILKDCARITDDHIDCYACIGANENVVQIPETEYTTNEETLVKTIDTTSTNGCRQSHHGHSEDRMSTNKGK